MKWKVWVLLVVLAALGALATAPAAAQSFSWVAEYYNNTNLTDPKVLTRTEGALNFNWGAGSPAAEVNADNFSVRFAADPFFRAGNYRFFILADDAVRLAVGFPFQPQLDTVAAPQVGQIVSVDIALPEGVSHVQLDYQEFSGNAYVYMQWFNLAQNPNPQPNFPPIGAPPPGQGGGSPGNPPIIPVGNSPWTAQYYANAILSGSPTAILSEVTPTRDWGSGSPVSSIPADNWSARWTSTQTLPAGNYLLRVRADDGIRVVINGITYINQWAASTGQTYTATVPLGAGQHVFLVEFYEASGNAFLAYEFGLPGAVVQPTQPPVLTGAYMTVTGAFRLNVRNIPSAVRTTILTKINRNESYPIVGRNANSSWWQINVNGIVGWVNARFVTAFNAVNVPVTDGGVIAPPPPSPTAVATCNTAPPPRLVVGRNGRVTPGLPNNIRQQPTSNSALLGQIPTGGVFSVIAAPVCANGFYWWQVNYNGTVGWTPEGGSGQYWLEPL
jgi:uncharacterized protein YgiM (DUF1202 family)